jgi:2-polyprenyl-3-methyl-5-hydroxy-6-metoxy-1,4-benzoquinol methylase
LNDVQAAVDDYGKNHWLKNQVYKNLFTKPWHAARIKAVCDNMRGDEILDVACASGELTEQIRLTAKPKRIVGYEGCGDVIDFGKSRYPMIEWVHGLVEAIPFKPKSFDAVHAGEILEHIYEPADFIARLSEITRERLVVSTPRFVINDPGHVCIFTIQALAEMLFRNFIAVNIIQAPRTFIAVCVGPK